MYNRYIRSDHGAYTRIPQEDPPIPPSSPDKSQEFAPPLSDCTEKNSDERVSDGVTGFLRHLLDRFHLDHVDTGDLLLLLLLFLLFQEDAEEELLVALGLLLIL